MNDQQLRAQTIKRRESGEKGGNGCPSRNRTHRYWRSCDVCELRSIIIQHGQMCENVNRGKRTNGKSNWKGSEASFRSAGSCKYVRKNSTPQNSL